MFAPLAGWGRICSSSWIGCSKWSFHLSNYILNYSKCPTMLIIALCLISWGNKSIFFHQDWRKHATSYGKYGSSSTVLWYGEHWGVNPVPTWVGPPPHWHQRFPRIWVPRQYQWSILSGLGVDINNWAGGQSWALKWSLHCRNTPKCPKELHLKLKPLPCHCPTLEVEGSPHRCAQSHSRPFELAAHQPDWDLCRSGSLQQLPGRSVDHSRRTGRCLGEGF